MPAVISLGLIVGGALFCLFLVRRVKGSRCLAVVVLGSYSLRVALAVGLYLVSAYELPIFRALQLPEGFWRFTYDAPFYHENAVRIAETLRAGRGLAPVLFGDQPFLVDSYEFFYFVGMVYWVFGPHPLWVPLLNAALWGVVAVLCYALARGLGGERSGRIAATLVSFWPSALLWSSQILKDTLMIFLLMVSFFLIGRVWQARSWGAFVAGALLVPPVFLLARIREYMVALLIVAVVAALGLTVLFRVRELGWRGAARALAAIALLWMPFLVAGYLAPDWLSVLTRGSTDPFQIFDADAHGYLVAPTIGGPKRDARRASAEPSKSRYRRRSAGMDGWDARRASAGPSKTGVAETSQESTGAPAEAPPADARKRRPLPEQIVQLVARGSVDLAAKTYNLGNIDLRRGTFAKGGGQSTFQPIVGFRSFRDRVVFLPRGLAYGLYAPFPWHWFPATGDTGRFKAFAGVETILMAGMTPFLLLGILRAAASRRADAWLLLFFGVIMFSMVALTVTNYGTLFRLRLQALVPLLVLVSVYGSPPPRVRALWERLRSRRSSAMSGPGAVPGPAG